MFCLIKKYSFHIFLAFHDFFIRNFYGFRITFQSFSQTQYFGINATDIKFFVDDISL